MGNLFIEKYLQFILLQIVIFQYLVQKMQKTLLDYMDGYVIFMVRQ